MKEYEIRPQDLLKRYLELSAADAKHCFSHDTMHSVDCVACGHRDATFQFEKHGFAYELCRECCTLYLSPRPSAAAFEQFYRNSESSKYWAEIFFPAVAEIRREKIFRPRMERLVTICDDINLRVDRLVDIGAGFGIFLDEWCKRFPDVDAVAVEPSTSLAAECRAKGLRVVESVAQHASGLDNFADLVVCFEVLEHVDDPLKFVNDLKKMARPGGYVFISTLCIDGFDLQMLWEKSTQISPPHHINILSVRGFQSLFNRAGLFDVQVSTPGQLDVEIVRNFAKNDSSLLTGQRFLRTVLDNDYSARSFQSFLSENCLSSHAWVLGKKPL